MIKGFFISFSVLLVFINSNNFFSQDIHFSQLFSNPLLLNPALSGKMDNNLRFSNSYRKQWFSISKNDYSTYSSTLDGSFYKNKISAGANFYSDKTGDGKLSTTGFNLSLASNITINKKNKISIALQSGWCQRSVDFSQLTWDLQYNGSLFDSNLPSEELTSNNSKSFFDISSGIYWKYLISKNVNLNSGIGFFHLNRPNQSIYLRDDKLNIRSTYHFEFEIKSTNFVLYPSFILMKQGNLYQKNIGFITKKWTGSKQESSSLSLGASYRFDDALVLYLGYEYLKKFSVLFSYDMNISKLTNATNTKGGIEISLIWKLLKVKNT